MSMWVLSTIGAEYMRRPVPQWSNHDVLEWMGELGDSIQNECLETFKNEVRKLKNGLIDTFVYFTEN